MRTYDAKLATTTKTKLSPFTHLAINTVKHLINGLTTSQAKDRRSCGLDSLIIRDCSIECGQRTFVLITILFKV